MFSFVNEHLKKMLDLDGGLPVWDWPDGPLSSALNAQARMGGECWRNTWVWGSPRCCSSWSF